MPLKCLVFDCDGVILDSVPIKSRAFARLAEPYGAEAVDRLVLYHAMHGGVSRYLKFEWFFKEILKKDITKEESEEWGKRFEQFSLEEVRRCPLINGILQTLEKWHGKLPMYVCTGAPEKEVKMILEERGLKHFFEGIYGSPPVKSKLLELIVQKAAKVEPEETLMVGDASTDLMAAEIAGTLFYGTGPDLKGGNYPWSKDLLPLNDWIAEHIKEKQQD